MGGGGAEAVSVVVLGVEGFILRARFGDVG